MSIFNKDFYPTPVEVLDMMGFDASNKIVLEPSVGAGAIVDYLKAQGATKVIGCEFSIDLSMIAQRKLDTFIKPNFLHVTKDEVSHIDMIVANPPFSKGVQHILHMWEIAPDGCEIYTLFNYDNLVNAYGEVNQLKRLIDTYGSVKRLGEVFKQAERTTSVNVGLIKLFKPASEATGFEGFFIDDEHEVNTDHGLIKPNAIRDLVERYVDALKEFQTFKQVQERMNGILKPLNVQPLSATMRYESNSSDLTYDQFVTSLQKVFWSHVFNLMNLNKFFTEQVRDKLNKFSEQQQKVPFTMKNIYKMAEIIAGTSDNIFKEALIEAVEKFTMHTHENRFMVEGWKTNSGYMLNEKFICGYVRDGFYSYPSIRYNCRTAGYLDDLTRVLCNITGNNYNDYQGLYNFFQGVKEKPNDYASKYIYKDFGTWYNWGFFTIKMFKKGTLHVKFNDRDVWALLNQRYAKIKGQIIPEKI